MRVMSVKLSPGERLFIWQRRKRFTNKQLADIFEVSTRTINNWKRDRNKHVPIVDLSNVQPWERCYIIRWREKISAEKMCKVMKISKTHFNRWENGQRNWHRLVDFYTEMGDRCSYGVQS